MKNSVAIVVTAYNRPASLERLLQSLARLEPSAEATSLVISVDAAPANTEVVAIAERFEWRLGDKRIIRRESRLGLKSHVLACGDLGDEYGIIVLLEDDLMVAPGMLDWVSTALRATADDERIAGVGLYSYSFNEYAWYPFVALADGYDNYYCQVPCSWGWAFTRPQWRAFRAYLSQVPAVSRSSGVPPYVVAWPETSWKKHHAAYLVAHGRYLIYPRTALSTNMGDRGTHVPFRVNMMQVPMQFGRPGYHLSRLDDSLARYDAFFELEPEVLRRHCPSLAGVDFEVDLYGTKGRLIERRPFAISSHSHPAPLKKFGLRLTPHEANVIYGVPGEAFALGESAAFGARLSRLFPAFAFVYHLLTRRVRLRRRPDP